MYCDAKNSPSRGRNSNYVATPAGQAGRRRVYNYSLFLIAAILTGIVRNGIAESGERFLTLDLRTRDLKTGEAIITPTKLAATNMAIVVTDMWSYHWCKTCAQRAGALIPRMNKSFEAARGLGITIIWAPSDGIAAYPDFPQRTVIASFPDLPLIPVSSNTAFKAPTPPGGPGGCMCGSGCPGDYGEEAMHPDLKIGPNDFICAGKQELYNVCKAKGITCLIQTGIALNMCVWGKECGLIATSQLGFQNIVGRDVTDAFDGNDKGSDGLDRFTALVTEHIERYGIPSINLLDAMHKAAGAREEWAGDPVRFAPWGVKDRPQFFPNIIVVSMSLPWHEGAEIRYTTDGSAPTPNAPLYREPLTVTNSAVISAAGFKNGKQVSLANKAYYYRLPDQPLQPDIFISDLQWTQASVPGYIYWPNCQSWNMQGLPPPQKDKSYGMESLKLRGVEYKKGMGVRAPSRLLYALKDDYAYFSAKAGVDETVLRKQQGRAMASYPSVIFKVLIDGVLAAESPVMRMQQEPWRFKVPIPKGSRVIDLVASGPANIPCENLANWVNAGFVLRKTQTGKP